MTTLTVLAFLAGCGEAPPVAPDAALDDSASMFRTKDDGGSNGDYNYCDGATTCDAGEADCDIDAHCTGALVCGQNLGSQFGFAWTTDVCVESHCTNGIQDADETGVDVGGADCGTCGGVNGDPEYCTEGCPCAAGEGDCDTDADCAAGLNCTPNVGADYGLSASTDVCLATLTEADLVAGDLVITEVMNDPDATGDGNGEWFEVFNNSGRDIDLDGVTFLDDGNNSFTVAGPLVVGRRSHTVFGVNSNPAQNGGVTVDYEFPNQFQLANNDDELVIENAAGVEIDRIEWDGGPNWPDTSGLSMVLDRAPGALEYATDNNDPANWCTSQAVAPLYMDLPDHGSPGWWNFSCP